MSTDVSQVTYGIDNDGHLHEIIDGVGRRMGVGPHPLASRDGIKLLCLWLEWDARWDALTKAQQRCLLDPTTRSTRPWKALQDRGYADDIGLTEAGKFLATFKRMRLRSSVVAS